MSEAQAASRARTRRYSGSQGEIPFARRVTTPAGVRVLACSLPSQAPALRALPFERSRGRLYRAGRTLGWAMLLLLLLLLLPPPPLLLRTLTCEAR